MGVEMRDVAPGLWLWRQPHPAWEEGNDWEPEVASFVVESRGEVVALDPLAPPPSARAVWDRLEAAPPSSVVVLKPDHVRDVDLFVRWYGARAYGPFLFWRDDIPQSELEPVRLGDELPGGLRAWSTPWHAERVVPALRALLELPFERVLVSHGDPVHTRADFEAALEREPWSESRGA
jgi:glyoxylase-like metal-dependent hydrolase (beta-lactamase superfamily II)